MLRGYFFRFVFTTLMLALSISHPNLFGEALKISMTADAALLINADTGAVLYEKNAKVQYYPASITKIATALYALKKRGANLDDVVTAEQDSVASVTAEQKVRANYKLPAYWQEVGGSHIGIKVGEKLTLRDLLFGMMVASGNDAANVISQHVSGSIPIFVTEMNAYLKEIGCKDTCFLNPHGLHHPDHKTTAYDMATMTREALENPLFREIVSTVRYTRPKTNKQESTTLVQTNRLLRSGQYYYSKAIGVKTGHHSKALNTFVGAAQQDGRTLIAVILHNKERNDTFKDAIALFEAAFKQPKVQRVLLRAGSQKYALKVDGAVKPVQAYLKDDISIEYYPAEEPQMKALVFWDKLSLPIAKDQKIGELRVTTPEGAILQSVPVYAKDEVKESWINWLGSYFSVTAPWLKWTGILIGILVLIGFMLRFRR